MKLFLVIFWTFLAVNSSYAKTDSTIDCLKNMTGIYKPTAEESEGSRVVNWKASVSRGYFVFSETNSLGECNFEMKLSMYGNPQSVICSADQVYVIGVPYATTSCESNRIGLTEVIIKKTNDTEYTVSVDLIRMGYSRGHDVTMVKPRISSKRNGDIIFSGVTKKPLN